MARPDRGVARPDRYRCPRSARQVGRSISARKGSRRWHLGRRSPNRPRASSRRCPTADHHQRRHAFLTGLPMATDSPLLNVVAHPLVLHKLSLMRDRSTSTSKFRQLMREVSHLLLYEATRELPLEEREIETPLERAMFPVLAGKKLCLVSILRAGNGFLDGMLELVPSARVGHIGIYRDPRTLEAIEYYLKFPDDLSERDVILVDPMLATGNSAVAAISRLVELRARSIKFVCLVAAPEGIEKVHRIFPDVAILTASIDRCLNDHGYILPRLGDTGDRLFGTK